MRRCAPPSSTTDATRSPRPRRTSGSAGCPCGSASAVGRVPSPEQRSEATPYSGAAVLERVAELPGGPELLRVAAGRGDVELVGGATRDLLLGTRPRELDVVVGTDAHGLARELADA